MHIKMKSNPADQAGNQQILFLVLLLCGVTAGYAAIALRGLYADGAFYLLYIILNQDFVFWESARKVVHALQQWPVVLAMKAGIADTITLARIYGLTMLLTPITLIILAYFALPQERKYLFVFPVFYYLAAIMSAAFAAIGEAQIAGAYFWLLYFLILFYRTSILIQKLALLVLSCPIILMHETYAIIAPVLAAAAVYRFIRSGKTVDQVFFGLLALYFVAVAIMAMSFILIPRSAEYRTGYMSYFSLVRELGFLGHHGYVNPPAVLGLLTGLILLLGWLRSEKSFSWLSQPLLAMFWLTALVAGISPLLSDRASFPALQFDARSYGPLLIPVMALITISAISSMAVKTYCESTFIKATVLALAIGQCGWHFFMTREWQQYLTTFHEGLAQHRGLIAFEDFYAEIPPERRRSVDKMTWTWTNPTLSILLANNGDIQTIIANPKTTQWEPFDPRLLNDALMRSHHFDFTAYRAALTQTSNALP